MSPRHQILIVTQTPALGNHLRSWLSAEGYWITVAATFAAAKFHLQTGQPTLVITELKLGEYNGLHLAVRATSNHVPVLVIGEHDTFFEHEAEQLGATYLALAELRRDGVLSFVEHQIARFDTRDHDHLAWISESTVASMRSESSNAGMPTRPGRRLRIN
jgi:DNA-binding NtrC family response regulator